ncbi:hypothetical protein PENANT_c014G06232 [Penicillium antarcticum]|uniref:HCNGP-like protein n=1 Tax=Penicillium antarcticum TaxID=416450 RepID=A0A1V6Q3U7_9EURO|nr:uncharacterized protein N7508_004514 [Penicillium antarcticum]KAJ5309135.1 hypothetical protein N7508_004514 [Penicillium antarcticum]OQD83938.1 hypothetical protein PENANT_c014G06232 [Penicillium antarcticum]
MLGLGAYESSSENEVELDGPSQPQHTKEPPDTAARTDQGPIESQYEEQVSNVSTNATNLVPDGPVLGPESIDQAPNLGSAHITTGRSSPFLASRTLIQDLTLPPVPNLDIPPSPPGSPDAAANAKFEHFLTLKKRGVHFNSKLAGSSSLKNPSLMMKMMNHVGINEQSQHDTSLPVDLWDASSLPRWGFKEEILSTQQAFRQKMEEKKSSGQRSSVDFVSGSA